MKKIIAAINKKRKRKSKTRIKGAVTVFLTVVLIPTIVFAAVFTDISRVQYSKAMAESAADLALDSLISRYDENLEQYYGMVASCQNIDDFYDKTIDYFDGMMRAEGISGENVDTFNEFMYDYIKTENVSDFLKVELDKAGIQISDMDSQLDGNAALIEAQIVEFMKYRGPVAITEKVINRFIKDGSSNVLDGVDEAEKNEPVVEARQEYAEAQGEFLEAVFYTYLAIRRYDAAYHGERGNESEANIPSEKEYNSLEENTRNIWDDYKELTRLLTNYYICSDGVDDAKTAADSIPDYPIDWDHYSKEDIGSKVTVDEQVTYYLSSQAYNSLYASSNYQGKIQAVTNAANAIRQALESVQTPNESDLDEVVYLLELKKALDGQRSSFETLWNDGEYLLSLHAKITAALQCEAPPQGTGDALPSDWRTNLADEKGKIYDCWVAFLSPGQDETQHDSGYKTRIKEYIELAGRVKKNIDNEGYTFDSAYLGKNDVSPSEFLREAGPDLETLKNILHKRHEELQVAINGGTIEVAGEKKVVKKLDEIQGLYNEYLIKTEEWGSSSEGVGTGYADQEHQRYENIKEGKKEDATSNREDTLASEIKGKNLLNEQSIEELNSRLSSIDQDILEAERAIESFQYGGVSVSDISSLSELITAASGVIPSESDIRISVNNQAADKYYSSLIVPKKEDLYKAPEITEKNDPNLDNSRPELYEFLKNQFQDSEDNISEELSDNKKRSDDWKKQGKEAEKKSKEADLEDPTLSGHGTSPLNALDPHGENPFGVGSAILSLIKGIKNIVDGGTEIRDQIYVIEYVMDMFSYSSFNTEGKLKLAGDGKTYKDFESYNNNEKWEDEDFHFHENKSMTNRMINSDNNQFNLAEVEYILFGETDMQKCLAKSYTGIYTIRLTLNLVSGFENFYSGNNTTASAITLTANSIAIATHGIVPACVTKCVLITALSALEAAKDLEVLKKGDSVLLYKTDADDWFCSFESAANSNKDGTFGEKDISAGAKGLYYSDYMYIFLLLNTSNYEDMLYRIGDLVEANMRQSNKDFDLSKTKCFFKMTAHAKVKPLMLTLPIVQSYGTGNMLISDTWCSYDIKTIRGY